MSVSAVAPDFASAATRPAPRSSLAFEQAHENARHPVRATARFALRAFGYTVAAILGLGGLPAALAVIYDTSTFSIMFAL
jgi:hypothetical protein